MGNPSNRSMWSGFISFGLVVVPVKLYSATASHDVTFHMAHIEDEGRVKMPRKCVVCGKELEASEIGKGYEYGEDQMLVLTAADLENLPVPSAKTIEVQEFVDPARIDPLLLEKSYYVAPANGAAEPPYALMTEVMRQQDFTGLVKVTIRQRESTALLRTHRSGLILTLLAWGDELRDPPVNGYNGTPDPALVTAATALMDAMRADFDPARYTDDYATALDALVAEKLGKARPTARPKSEPAKASTSLADALTASLDALQQAKRPRRKPAAEPAEGKPATTPRRRASKSA